MSYNNYIILIKAETQNIILKYYLNKFRKDL